MPGAGPSLDGRSWIIARHPKHGRRRKPYLTDNIELGREFQKHYLRGLRRLLRQGKLKIGGTVGFLANVAERDSWLEELEQTDWNVFIEGPPPGTSDPANVVKYLARYLTGGPISDQRLISVEDGVEFWARPKRAAANPRKHRGMHPPLPFRLSGRQFMQRWTLHILPKGFTKSRCYGGYHGTKRQAYLQNCRELLNITEHDEPPSDEQLTDDASDQHTRRCPNCECAMICIKQETRPSWRELFNRTIYQSSVYVPLLHVRCSRAPPL